VQGPPLAQAALFANHENMAQANFMLHAVARWRAPDAWNSNKSLLMPAADPHVNCRCACPKSLPFDHGPTRSRGIRRAERASGHTNLQDFKTVQHYRFRWECDNGYVPPREFDQEIGFAPDPTWWLKQHRRHTMCG
jgi:hypothetical protein